MSKRGALTIGLVLGVLGLTIFGGYFQDILEIRMVVVEGGERITDDDVQGMMNIKIGDNFIGIDLQAATMRLQQHPWVRSAFISLQYPRVHVAIQERHPFVVVQTLQGLMWCDKEGVVLMPYLGQTQGAEIVVVEGLSPVSSGSRIGSNAQWKTIKRLLQTDFSNLFKIEKLYFFTEWVELFIKDQQRIQLPLARLNEALGRLQSTWTLLRKRVSLHSLDLRFPGEIVYEGAPY